MGKEPTINIHHDDGTVVKFTEVESGLYLYNTEDKLNKTNFSDYSFPQLVSENKMNYTRSEIEGADKAKELYRKIGMPGYRYFFIFYKQTISETVHLPQTMQNERYEYMAQKLPP